MERDPKGTCGRLYPPPITVVVGAVRRGWARIVETVNGERRLLEQAAVFSGDLDSLLVQHAVRHGRNKDGSHRVFRAPDLMYDPPVQVQPVHGSRHAAMPFRIAARTRHDSSSPDTK